MEGRSYWPREEPRWLPAAQHLDGKEIIKKSTWVDSRFLPLIHRRLIFRISKLRCDHSDNRGWGNADHVLCDPGSDKLNYNSYSGGRGGTQEAPGPVSPAVLMAPGARGSGLQRPSEAAAGVQPQLTSPVPLAFLLLLDLPGKMLVGLRLLVLLQLAHVALLISLRLVQVSLRRKEKRKGRWGGPPSREENQAWERGGLWVRCPMSGCNYLE